MTSLVNAPDEKYFIYNNKNVYYKTEGISGVMRRLSRKDETRYVSVDWKKYGEIIERASEDSKISLDDIKAVDEEKKESESENIRIPRIMSDIKFWNIVNSLRYVDIDERFINLSIIKLKINTKKSKKILFKLNNQFIPELKSILDAESTFSGTSISSFILYNDISAYENFITHIIFKGYDFYNGVKETPLLSLYLYEQNQYYPIYKWLTDISNM